MFQSGAEAFRQCVAAWACLRGQLTLCLVFSICANTQTKREREMLGVLLKNSVRLFLTFKIRSKRFVVQNLLLLLELKLIIS